MDFKNGIYFVIVILLLQGLPGIETIAQNRLSISSSHAISLDFKPVFRPGVPVSFFKDDSKWLNYTILLEPGDPACSISVQIVAGEIPEGIDIKVKAGTFAGTGNGSPGIPVEEVNLSHIPQVIIDNIGTCYTGSGIKTGHQLIYTVEIKNFEKLESDLPSLQLLYTITQ